MRGVVYVDVDDTLVREVSGRRIPIPRTVALVRRLHAEGVALYGWSRGGADYVREVAIDLGIGACFTAFLPKPSLLIDDQAIADWTFLACVHPAQADGDAILARLAGP